MAKAKARKDLSNRKINNRTELIMSNELTDGTYQGKLKKVFDAKDEDSDDFGLYAIGNGQKTFIMASAIEGDQFPMQCTIAIEDNKVLTIKGE